MSKPLWAAPLHVEEGTEIRDAQGDYVTDTHFFAGSRTTTTKAERAIAEALVEAINSHDELLDALNKAAQLMGTYGTGGTKHVDPTTGGAITPVMQEIFTAIAKAERGNK